MDIWLLLHFYLICWFIYWFTRQMYLVRIVESGCDIQTEHDRVPVGGTLFLESGIYETVNPLVIDSRNVEGRSYGSLETNMTVIKTGDTGITLENIDYPITISNLCIIGGYSGE